MERAGQQAARLLGGKVPSLDHPHPISPPKKSGVQQGHTANDLSITVPPMSFRSSAVRLSGAERSSCYRHVLATLRSQAIFHTYDTGVIAKSGKSSRRTRSGEAGLTSRTRGAREGRCHGPRPFEFHHAGPLTLDRRNGPASLADLELLV
jgi:hypothetical protein